MRMTVLGSSAIQTVSQETSAFILTEDDRSILIDCGPGIPRAIQLAKIDPLRVPDILITHMHGDHVAGLPYLLFIINQQAAQLKPRRPEVRVWISAGLQEAVRTLIAIQYASGYANIDLDFRTLTPGSADNTGPFEIVSVPATHTTATVSTRISTANASVGYSSDTLYSPDFVELASDCNVMLHEAFGTAAESELATRAKHSIASDAGRAAHNAAASRLLLMHALPKYVEEPAPLIDEARQEYKGPITMPVGLDTFEVQ